MKGTIKANLITFLIISIIAFSISSIFADLTISEDNEPYKLIPIENDSFEPNYINKVPTIQPKIEKNITNNTTQTDNNTKYEINQTNTSWNETYTQINKTITEYLEY